MSESAGAALPIPGNRWDLLPPVTSRENPFVSVCIPTRNGGSTLDRTLRMLALQSYPLDRLEVVVADDGSDPPLELESTPLPYRLTVVRQEAQGFGAGRARNLAASRASGEILVFLDGDVIPEIGVVRDYVDWVQRHPLCVPFGFSRFVDLSLVSDERLARALREGVVDRIVDPIDVDSQEYREPYFHSTNDLTIERTDLYRVFVTATFAVSAEFFEAVGGFRELGVRGVEDIELGYRLVNRGALLVPVRSAQHWHQGRRTMSGERIAEIRRARQPFVERLLPVGGFRPERPLRSGPVRPVCRFVAHIASGCSDDSVAAVSIRAARQEDVQLAAEDDEEQAHTFADVFLPAELSWSTHTGALLVRAFEDFGVGTLRLVGDDHAPVIVRRRRAACRSKSSTGTASDSLAEQLFGVAVMLASEAGITDPVMARRAGPTPLTYRVAAGWRRLRRAANALADIT